MTVINILNQKGGVGKTTVAFNLGAGLALKNKKVLFIDLDSQANLTYNSGVQHNGNTIYEVLREEISPQNAILEIKKNLYILPSRKELAYSQVELTQNIASGNKKLSMVLNKIKNDFDFILIDNGPALNILTYNSLAFSDSVLIVLQANSIYSLTGLDQVTKTIKEVRNSLNKNLCVLGLLFNQYNPRTVIGKDIVSTTEIENPGLVLKTKIRKNIALSESQANKTDIFQYDPKSNGAIDFKKLVKEILNKVK